MATLTATDKKLKGQYVRFKVRDIHLPDPAVILRELHNDEELSGKVVDLSDSGRSPGIAFAVVKVPRLRRPCVVLVDRLVPRRKRQRDELP